MANYCPNCGVSATSNASFCSNCGAALHGNANTSTNNSYAHTNATSTVGTILGTLVAVSLIGGLTRQLYYYRGRYFLDPYCRRPFCYPHMIMGRHRIFGGMHGMRGPMGIRGGFHGGMHGGMHGGPRGGGFRGGPGGGMRGGRR